MKRQWNITKECTKLMFTREHWWILAMDFVICFCMPSLFTDKVWIYLVSGIVFGYPLAILTIMTEWLIIKNKEDLHETIVQHVEDLNK